MAIYGFGNESGAIRTVHQHEVTGKAKKISLRALISFTFANQLQNPNCLTNSTNRPLSSSAERKDPNILLSYLQTTLGLVKPLSQEDIRTREGHRIKAVKGFLSPTRRSHGNTRDGWSTVLDYLGSYRDILGWNT